MRQLEPIIGEQLSGPVLQQLIHRILYEDSTRRISIMLRDGTQVAYTLPQPNRPGVMASASEAVAGRVPRISRLMAVALKFEQLVQRGAIRSYGEVAQLGRAIGGANALFFQNLKDGA